MTHGWRVEKIKLRFSSNWRLLNPWCQKIFSNRQDLCSKTSCSTLGLAHSGGLCEPMKNCNINEDNGLNLPYTIAHEIAHNLNATHDESVDGSSNDFIMSPQLSTSSESLLWSGFSSQEISQFLKYFVLLLWIAKNSTWITRLYSPQKQIKLPFRSHIVYRAPRRSLTWSVACLN